MPDQIKRSSCIAVTAVTVQEHPSASPQDQDGTRLCPPFEGSSCNPFEAICCAMSCMGGSLSAIAPPPLSAQAPRCIETFR
jgi:hypothetical protein